MIPKVPKYIAQLASDIPEEDLHRLIEYLACTRIILVGACDKENFEALVGFTMSDETFQNICNYMAHNDRFVEVYHEMIKDMFKQYQKELEAKGPNIIPKN